MKVRKPLRLRALDHARGQLGVKESPAGTNRVKFSRWYGMTGPWCAMFATWAYAMAGSHELRRGFRYAYVPFIVSDARARRHGLKTVSYFRARPGDLVCFDWDGGVADHVGILEKKVRPWGRGYFQTIEGNTALGNDSNGGEVMRRRRHKSQVQAFVRVTR